MTSTLYTTTTSSSSYYHSLPNSLFSSKSNPLSNSHKPFAIKIDSFSSKSSKSQLPIHIPIVIKTKGKDYRYIYDGNSLELVTSASHNHRHAPNLMFRSGVAKCIGVVTDFFIPKNVSCSYVEYVKWKFLHRVFSSALQFLATQAMFRAIGVGYAQSLPSAAALNWLLKDGLGRLSRCIYTACVGSAFDTYLKRVRFATSVLFSLSIGLELLTPVFPNCFLLLASVANIAKQISLACHLATSTAIHRSFALADNLGEVSAKAQIQTVCFDNLGLLLAAFLNVISQNNPRLQVGLPFVVYPIFSAIDLCGIYQSLKHVHLQTLTKDRLEIILNTWIRCGYVPSPAEVSKVEGISLFEDTRKNKGKWPIRIGCLDPKRQVPLLTMLTITSMIVDDYYFIYLETQKSQRKGIVLALREGAAAKDIITGLLQVCYIREAILSSGDIWENIDEAYDISRQWVALIQKSRQSAQKDQNLLQEQIENANWAAKNVLLNTQEQARYDFVNENI